MEENSGLVDYLKSLSYSVSISEESDLPQIEEEMKRAGLIKVNKNSASKNKDKEILSAPKRYEIEGFSVFVGKNNLQNEQVSFRIAKAKDIWLHTQTIHSGHVAIITEGREVPPVCAVEGGGNYRVFFPGEKRNQNRGGLHLARQRKKAVGRQDGLCDIYRFFYIDCKSRRAYRAFESMKKRSVFALLLYFQNNFPAKVKMLMTIIARVITMLAII